jgi:hypothetical protein
MTPEKQIAIIIPDVSKRRDALRQTQAVNQTHGTKINYVPFESVFTFAQNLQIFNKSPYEAVILDQEVLNLLAPEILALIPQIIFLWYENQIDQDELKIIAARHSNLTHAIEMPTPQTGRDTRSLGGPLTTLLENFQFTSAPASVPHSPRG